jgi:aspartate-semialdehyde dehydrogenase
MLPASELGEGAVQELHQQVVQLLNFGSPPTEFLGEQLAFNLVPPREKGGEEALEDSVTKEASELAGLETDSLSVSLVRVPVFHSYALSLWVKLAGEPTPEAVAGAVGEREDIEVGDALESSAATAATPVSVAGAEKVRLGRLRRDGSRRGAFRLWVVADSMAVDAAANALDLAEKLLGASGDTGE